jgi:hypothetical protein
VDGVAPVDAQNAPTSRLENPHRTRVSHNRPHPGTLLVRRQRKIKDQNDVTSTVQIYAISGERRQDRLLFWTAADLELKLLKFQRYHNGHRAHAGLEGRTPEPSTEAGGALASVRSYRWQSHCRGLYQTPMAA